MAVVSYKGRLYLDFTFYLPDGSRKTTRESTTLTDTQKNRKKVEAKNKAIRYELRNGTFDYLRHFPHGAQAHRFRDVRESLTFSDWWDQWISEKSLRPTTERGWNSSFRVHLEPHFGHYLLAEIDEHEILVFRKRLEAKGLKASTINDKIIKPLCMVLYRAHARGLIDRYPCTEIKRLSEPPIDIDPFSFDELRQFLEALKTKRPMYHDLVLVWSRTGPRPGERYALKWPHLDRYNQKLMIRETRLPSGSEGPPKTKHSSRDIDLRPAVLEAFRRQEERTGLQGKHVFLTEAAKPFSDAFMRKKFKGLCQLARIKHRPPKQLRHTFATLHLAAGEQITWVSRTLGHSSAKVTWDRYNRFLPNLTREDGSAFESLMNNLSNCNNKHSKDLFI